MMPFVGSDVEGRAALAKLIKHFLMHKMRGLVFIWIKVYKNRVPNHRCCLVSIGIITILGMLRYGVRSNALHVSQSICVVNLLPIVFHDVLIQMINMCGKWIWLRVEHKSKANLHVQV